MNIEELVEVGSGIEEYWEYTSGDGRYKRSKIFLNSGYELSQSK
jgi:hypothetical protein